MKTTTTLIAAIVLLMIDSMIEISFISSMVAWLHRRGGRSFLIDYGSTTFSLHGKPLHMLADQGHTSNVAAGTAFILVGFLGLLALWLRGRNTYRSKANLILFHLWLCMTFLSTLLTFSALIYTFVITSSHAGQAIDLSVASQLDNQPYPNQVPYPLDDWTPENWFGAVLGLHLASSSDRSAIETRLHVMRGWRWNLIPMFILGLAVCVLATSDALVRRKERTQNTISRGKSGSTDPSI